MERIVRLAHRSMRLQPVLLGVLAVALVLLAHPAAAQEITVNLGDGQSFSLRTVQLFLLITLLSLAPGLAIMVTCFPFMVTVLSILRQAIGVQQAPPNAIPAPGQVPIANPPLPQGE